MYENKKQNIDLISNRLNELMLRKIEIIKEKLRVLKKNYVLTNPSNLYKNQTILIKTIIEKLELLNPLKVLQRGYTITYSNDKVIKSIKDVKENIVVKVSDGIIDAKVIKTKEVEHG